VFQRPQSVGRYEVQGELGAGGFATVYRAYDPKLDRHVALKILHPHHAHDAATRERFVREGRALARVRHPNIVQIHDAGDTEYSAYLAMELVEGRSLDAILEERGPLPLAEVVAVTEEVAGALAAVHARGLVHRDVKPVNILVEDDTGRAVLLDLGVVRAVDAATTASGYLVGTPGFMAPEQLKEPAEITARTDVYQLGATVYALLTGRPPFEGDTMRVLDAVARAAPPDLQDVRPDLPPNVAIIVARALAKNPGLRPAGTREFAGQLRAASAQAAPPVAPLEPTVRAPRPSVGAAARSEPPARVASPDDLLTQRIMPPLPPRPADVPAAGLSAPRPGRETVARPRKRRSALPVVLALGALALVGVAGGGLLIAKPWESENLQTNTITVTVPPTTGGGALSPTPTIAPTTPPTATAPPAATRDARAITEPVTNTPARDGDSDPSPNDADGGRERLRGGRRRPSARGHGGKELHAGRPGCAGACS
jgi:eukaryotic-like serine/threonine-protein kinase